MRVSEALELFEQSASSFKAEIESLSIKELYELVKDLRLFKNPEILKTSYDFLLNKKLFPLLKEVEALEKTVSKDKGVLILRHHIYKETGFNMGSEASPSIGIRKIIDEISGWSQ